MNDYMNQAKLWLTTIEVKHPYNGCFWEPQVWLRVADHPDEDANGDWWIGYMQPGWPDMFTYPRFSNERDTLRDPYGFESAWRITEAEVENLVNAIGPEDDGEICLQRLFYSATLNGWFADTTGDMPAFLNAHRRWQTNMLAIGEEIDLLGEHGVPIKYATNVLGAIQELVYPGRRIAYIQCAVCGDRDCDAAGLDPYSYSGDGGIGINVFSYRCLFCESSSEEWWEGTSNAPEAPANLLSRWRDMDYGEDGWVIHTGVNGVEWEVRVVGLWRRDILLYVDDEQVMSLDNVEGDEVVDWLVAIEYWLSQVVDEYDREEV